MEPSVQRFDAFATTATSPKDVVEGHLVFTRETLRFEAAGLSLEWLLDDLSVALSRTRAGGVEFSSASESEWLIRTRDQDVLDHRAFAQCNELRLQLREIRRRQEGIWALKLTAGFISVAVLLSFLGIWAAGFLFRQIVSSVPVAWEASFGDTLLGAFQSENKVVELPQASEWLRTLILPLSQAIPDNPYHFQFHLVDDPDPNAFAMPGGNIIVHTGLLKTAQRPEEIAGVLAHEMAHIIRRHGFRSVLNAAGLQAAMNLLFGGDGGFASMLGQNSQLLVRQKFSQSYEVEADELAWQYLLAANIDPRGLAEFLKRIKALEDSKGRDSALQVALSSHPPTVQRIERLESKWNQLRRPGAFTQLPKLPILESER